jgi:hypothetical protein
VVHSLAKRLRVGKFVHGLIGHSGRPKVPARRTHQQALASRSCPWRRSLRCHPPLYRNLGEYIPAVVESTKGSIQVRQEQALRHKVAAPRSRIAVWRSPLIASANASFRFCSSPRGGWDIVFSRREGQLRTARKTAAIEASKRRCMTSPERHEGSANGRDLQRPRG